MKLSAYRLQTSVLNVIGISLSVKNLPSEPYLTVGINCSAVLDIIAESS